MGQLRLATVDGRQVVDRTDEARELLNEVRLKVYTYDTAELASIVGVSVGTIMAFRSGRTVWPRPKTLFAILEALGYRLEVVLRRIG